MLKQHILSQTKIFVYGEHDRIVIIQIHLLSEFQANISIYGEKTMRVQERILGRWWQHGFLISLNTHCGRQNDNGFLKDICVLIP